MDIRQVAQYLHMDLREVRKLASRGQLPCRKVAGRFRFTKGDVDHWVETRMHELKPNRLAQIEKGVSAHHGFDAGEMLLLRLIPEGGLAVPLRAKTREAAIRGLVALADRTGVIVGAESRGRLLDEVRGREELCSTALMPGVALPHPRHPLEYDISRSFVVGGVTTAGIPFGSEDGTLTRLFFLICCKDDRTHLHVLARLARMLRTPGMKDDLMSAATPDEFLTIVRRCESRHAGIAP